MQKDDIGIIGYGRFGKVLTGIMSQDFDIHVFSHHEVEQSPGVHEATLERASSCKAVFLSVQMSKFEASLTQALPYLKPGTVVVDVCSVKIYPVKIMTRLLPEGVHMLPTHPMFGPDSIGGGMKGLPIVLCLENTPHDIAGFWLDYFKNKGLKVVEMPCDEHDRITAYSLCLTQFLGRIVDGLGIKSTDIDMQSFKNLLRMREISCNDSFELLRDLSTLNPYAGEMRRRFREELEKLEKKIG